MQSAKQMEAYRAFIEATEINPGYADAWFEKGVILAKQENIPMRFWLMKKPSK